MNTTAEGSTPERVPAATRDGRADVLVSPAWLTAHLSDPDVRVVEVDVSSKAYDDWHIDGAVLWNIYRDLKDPEYRLVEPAALESLLVRCGIGPQSTVVFYGYAPAMGVWLMTLLGHTDARILDCSRDTWQAEGHPWNNTATQPLTVEPATVGYRLGAEDHRVRADRAAVRAAIGRSDVRLVDVRSLAEYRGERFWPSGALEPNGRAGHVPSAVHQPIDGIYDQRGGFRTAGELHELFAPEFDDNTELITYCAIGGRAATAWFVLSHLLGRDNVRVYDGSWAEWGRMADTPVAVS